MPKYVVCADDDFSVKIVGRHYFKFTANRQAKWLNSWSISVTYSVATPEEAEKRIERKNQLLTSLGKLIGGEL